MMRGIALVVAGLVACDCSSPAEHPRSGGAGAEGAAATEPTDRSAAACGRIALTAPDDLPWDEPVEPTRAMWLEESLTLADAVVWGRAEGDHWKVEEVLCGELPSPAPRYTLGDEASELAVRFLVRTQRGYFDSGPMDRAATRREWDALQDRAEPREARELEVEETAYEVVHYATVDDERVRYGVSAAAGNDYVTLTLDDGTDDGLANRVFFRGRIGSWNRMPPEGRGFRLRWWGDGSIRDSEHLVDRRPHGVEQAFGADGTIHRSVAHRNGVRHGPSRVVDEEGNVLIEGVFDEGLMVPVTQPRSEPTAATLQAGRWTSYEAPDALIERITLGMRVQQVADLLGLPVSASSGVSFPPEDCGTGTTIHFRNGRVSERETTYWLGGCSGL